MAEQQTYPTATPLLEDYVYGTKDPLGEPLARNFPFEAIRSLMLADGPLLLSPTAAALTDGTTSSGGVSTGGSDGVLYWVSTTTSEKPGAQQVANGTDSNGNPQDTAGSQVVSASGVQSVTVTGHQIATQYYTHFMHQSADNLRSAVVTAPPFTTTDVPAVFGGADWSVVDANLGGQIDLTVSTLPDDGGATILDIQYTTDDGATWRTVGGVTAITYNLTLQSDGTSFSNDVLYTFKIRAQNINGNSAASTGKSATPTPPATVTTYEQAAAQFFADDAVPGAETPLAAVNEPIEMFIDGVARVWFLVKQLGTTTGATPTFELEYRRKPSEGSFGAWTNVGTPGFLDDPIAMALSSHFADRAAITQRLGSGTFTDGEAMESNRESNILNASVGQDEYEVVYNFTVDSDNTGVTPQVGDTYELRLDASGVEITSFPNVPSIVIISSSGRNPIAPTYIGFGSGVTGGRGGHFLMVTSLSDSAGTVGSLRWALAQFPGDPLYIAICVEGNINFSSNLAITRPNVTLDYRYAPGNACWHTGYRVEIEHNNILLDHQVHLGNKATVGGDADCIRIGDFGGSQDVDGFYCRHGEYKHGRDEVFSFTPRDNGASTGPRVLNATVESCIVADPTRLDQELLFFIGDGVEGLTCFNNLLMTAEDRFPFQREFSNKIEWFNNASYNFNQNGIHIVGDVEMDYIGNLLRMGPRWANVRAPILLDASNDLFEDDTLVDTKIGKTNSWGLFRGNTPSRGSRFTPTSGLTPLAASTVEARISSDCGPRIYGGARHANTQGTINDFVAGDAPTVLASHPGLTRSTTGAVYPPANGAGVPNAYLTEFPADTDPEAIIADASPWNGRMVAERIGEWLKTTPS